MNKALILFLFAIGISACGPLTKSQTNITYEYYQTLGSFTEYPNEISQQIAIIKFNRSKIYPSSFEKDSLMMETLISALDTFQSDMDTPAEVDSATELINQHVESYYLLTPNGFNYFKVLKNSSLAITRYFGFGIVSDVLNGGSSPKPKQPKPKNKQKIYKLIMNSEPIIKSSTMALNKYAHDQLKVLDAEEQKIRENYRKFLKSITGSRSSYDYYTKYNEIFIDHYNRLYLTKDLLYQLIESINELKRTHTILLKKMSERQKLGKGIRELQDFYNSINEMKKTIGKLNSLNLKQ